MLQECVARSKLLTTILSHNPVLLCYLVWTSFFSKSFLQMSVSIIPCLCRCWCHTLNSCSVTLSHSVTLRLASERLYMSHTAALRVSAVSALTPPHCISYSGLSSGGDAADPVLHPHLRPDAGRTEAETRGRVSRHEVTARSRQVSALPTLRAISLSEQLRLPPRRALFGAPAWRSNDS